jgi:hypothetical protein
MARLGIYQKLERFLIKSFCYICEGLVLVHRHFMKPRNVGSNFMKKQTTIFLLLISFLVHSQSIEKQLNIAYKTNSKELLKDFFLKWENEMKPLPIEQEKNINDTLKQVYKAYVEFYNPSRINKLGGSEFGNKIYKNVKYFVVQNSLKMFFTDKIYYSEKEVEEFIPLRITQSKLSDSAKQNLLKRKNGKLSERVIERYNPNNIRFENLKLIKRDSILNFRPKINIGSKKIVFLNDIYEKEISRFLSDSTKTNIQPINERENRKKFIENYVKIYDGHWGGYWQLTTYPEVHSIIFDKKMNYAKIYFRMIYQGGEAILKNDKGNWKLIESKLTWIE